MFKSLGIKSFSFTRIPFFSFAVVKKPKTAPEELVKPIWKNIYKRLKNFSDEHIKIEKNLHDSASDLEPRMKESLRIRLNEIEPMYSLHDKYKNIFRGLEELKEMGVNSNDDETKQFIREEKENYKNLLIDLEEKAIEFLIPKDKFDDCMSVNFEIRPGFFKKILFSV